MIVDIPEPLALPFVLTAAAIPVIYTLGIWTGNVSWVDRIWPFHPVLCSSLVVRWAIKHAPTLTSGSLPRLYCMLGLQFVWSARLTRNAIRREFYDLTSEDYRYKEFKNMVPKWFFELVHLFAVAIPQPMLLYSLCIPLYSVLKLAPTPSQPSTNIYDILLVISGLMLVYIEHTADNSMYAYQTAKHSSKSKDLVSPPPASSKIGPKPAAYPKEFAPGFIITSLFKYTRHPNFAAEQLFWLNQALFAINAGLASPLPRATWFSFAPILAPPFALSLLFCGSTFLTEFITGRKYPAYAAYKGLVGQFLPQETLLVRIWTALRGKTAQFRKEVFGRHTKKA